MDRDTLTVDEELLQLTDNETIQQFLGSKLIKFFSNDPTTKIAIVTAIITVGAFAIRLLDYIELKGYLMAYSIPIEYVNYSANQGFSNLLVNGIIFIGVGFGVLASYFLVESIWVDFLLQRELNKIMHLKFRIRLQLFLEDLFTNLKKLMIVLIVHSLFNSLTFAFVSEKLLTRIMIMEWLVGITVLSLFETFIGIVLYISSVRKKNKKDKVAEKEREKRARQERFKNNSELYTKLIEKVYTPFPLVLEVGNNIILYVFFVLALTSYFSGYMGAVNEKDYSLIEKNYAVVYQSDGYYWAVAAEVGDDLVINRERQRLIPVDNVEIQKMTFDNVVIQ